MSDELYNLDNEQIQACLEHSCQWPLDTGKFFSEALILASTNPQYDKRLFIELQVRYMKIEAQNMGRTQVEHVVYINCSECQNKINLCTHVLRLQFSCTELEFNEQSVVIMCVS